MKQLLHTLNPKERRGSKARCHLFTHGPADEVAARLTALAEPFARVSASDFWMPQGFSDPLEAQLHKPSRLIGAEAADRLAAWWLAPASRRALTPNFDIAATCLIGGKPGLLLVEAKAHDEELDKEKAGRIMTSDSSENRRLSHETISSAIDEARRGLESATALPFRISRESHYQMSNRFAWSWKLTELGIPVVLIYLGFLRAKEMEDRGRPITDGDDWEKLVKGHSDSLFPAEVWGRAMSSNGRNLIPLIRSIELPLGPAV